MPEPLDEFIMTRSPTPDRPLLGQTVLVIEDSRFASEALRLLCLRSGARIRRADSLRAAARHLAMYHPSVAIVDLGLPDGSGLDLIAELAATTPRIAVLMATSADDNARGAALEAGADGFLPKPFISLAAFQAAILDHIPQCDHPPGLRALADDVIAPDRLALRDDLAHVAEVLTPDIDASTAHYVAQFVGGLAKTAEDAALSDGVRALQASLGGKAPLVPAVAALQSLVKDRVRGAPIV